MSESTNPNASANGTATAMLDQAQMDAFLAFQEKERIRKEKAEAAKAERKRSNNRGVNVDGTERNATQAFLATAAALLSNWAEAYAEDPAQLVRRINEQLVPSLNAVANTGSTQMAGAQDQFRSLLENYRAPAKASAPAPTATEPTVKGGVK
jgi:hypothetical protein